MTAAHPKKLAHAVADPNRTEFDVIVVGAGFSGLALLYHLRAAGFATRVVDDQEEVGGTWWVSNYPGVRTDSEFHDYCFTFSKEVREEWTWTERYPSGAEVEDYLKFVADRLDLRRDIELGVHVDKAVYDEPANKWRLHLDDGRVLSAQYFISGMGVLNKPVYPNIPGLDTFKGGLYHTAEYPRDGVDLTGQRVGIIGTAASAIQAIPVIAEVAGDLFVFQRTPNYVMETSNDPVTPEWMADVREHYDEIFAKAAAHPFGVSMDIPAQGAVDVSAEERQRVFESKWGQGGFHFANECFNDLATNIASSELASEFIRSKIRQIVKDPATAELLCPKTYSFNGKRVPTGHSYYPTFNRPNVHLVDVSKTPISQITEKGLMVGDKEYELDVLILATGYNAMTGMLTAIDIVGRGGLILRDKWAKEGLRTNLGLSVHGFPNFFMSLGPQTPYSNLPVPIQVGSQWLQRLLVWARENNVPRIEATAASEQWWLDEVNRTGALTVMNTEGDKAQAWFLGHNVPGKERSLLVYVGGTGVYHEHCRQAEKDGYRTFLNDAVKA